MKALNVKSVCPCGSGREYDQCCGRFHRGEALPATPEELMRSRYSAYAMDNTGYLQQTWHPSTRPAQLDSEPQFQWMGLKIIDAPAPSANEGWVEFIASFQVNGRLEQMRERSRFLFEEGRWFYIDGQLHAGAKPDKIGRNDPCPCGSGRKYKRCCGVAG